MAAAKILWLLLSGNWYTACPKKVAHSNISLDRLLLWLQSTFAVALFQQPYAMSQHLFPSRVAFIFGRHFLLMTGVSNHSFSIFHHIRNTFNGIKSGLNSMWWPIHAWKWLSMLPWHSCVLMLHSFTSRARWILALLSWNMLEEKIHWRDNLVIQYIQELCWLAVPRPDQLKQPQIITLQFVDLSKLIFLGGQAVYMRCIHKG